MKLKPVDVSNCTDKELIELAAASIGYQKNSFVERRRL